MIRALRPVGEPLPKAGRSLSIDKAWPLPIGFDRHLYGSGTAALAVAMQTIVAPSGKTRPEAIIPAYTCPDVVSALQFAGVRPVLADLLPGRPWLNLEAAGPLVNEHTVALIGIDFQGIPERSDELRAFADARGIALVYDHCQGFPAAASVMADADYVVFSFGRGKPVSALVGGALVVNRSRQEALSSAATTGVNEGPGAVSRAAYNLLIDPRLYWLPSGLPFLGIGSTVYKPLEKITGLGELAQAQIASAISGFLARNQQQILSEYRKFIPESWDLARRCGVAAQTRLLRFPLLLPTAELRDRLLAALARARLGASALYPGTLEEIAGVSTLVSAPGYCDVAKSFSSRLVTLPVHSDVENRDIEKVSRIIGALV